MTLQIYVVHHAAKMCFFMTKHIQCTQVEHTNPKAQVDITFKCFTICNTYHLKMRKKHEAKEIKIPDDQHTQEQFLSRVLEFPLVHVVCVNEGPDPCKTILAQMWSCMLGQWNLQLYQQLYWELPEKISCLVTYN